MKRLLSLIISLVLFCTLLGPAIHTLAEDQPVKDDTPSTTRYSVLVIDVSSEVTFSVGGQPIFTANPATPYTKEAAKHFIHDLVNASGTNYCAIIAYSSEPDVISGFSDDFSFLDTSISHLDTISGMANIAKALIEAHALLDSIDDENAIKNCVLITTGNTSGGDYLEYGHYDSSVVGSNWVYSPTGINIYMYANAAYEASLPIKEEANLYVIGLFQTVADMPSSGAEVVALFRLIASDLASSSEYYYDVTDLDDLVFYFGEIADSITSDSLKRLFINQHYTYQNSDAYLIEIACGLGSQFGSVLEDVSRDRNANDYSFCKTLSQALDLDFDDIIESDVEAYELVLAKILCGETAQKKQQNEILVQYTSYLFDGLETVLDIKDSMVSTVVPSQTGEIRNLLTALSTLEAGSAEYCEALDGILRTADALGDPQFIASLKSELLVGIVFDAADALLDTVSDIVQYRACYNAFCNATDEFISVLTYSLVWFYEHQLNDNGMPDIGYFSQIMSEVYDWDIAAIIRSFNVVCLEEAVVSILSNINECRNDSGNVTTLFNHIISIIAENGGEFTSDVFESCGKFILGKLIDCIPVIGHIKAVYDVGKLLLDSYLFIDTITSNDDERALCVDLIRKSHFVAAMFSEICHDHIGQIAYDDVSDENFKTTLLFDTAISAYESTLSFAASYAIKYEEYLFKNEKASWFSNQGKLSRYAANISNLKRILDDCSSPWCHTKGLLYDNDSGSIVYNEGDLIIVIIACPVEVFVSDSSGNLIADISSTNMAVTSGYENYFHSIFSNTGDCSKAAIIPASYRVSLSGESAGTMDVYMAKLKVNTPEDAIAIRNIPVSEDTYGELIDSQSNEGLFDILVDGTILVGTDADEHSHTYSEPVFSWEPDCSRCTLTIRCSSCDFSESIPCEVTVTTTFDQISGILTITYFAAAEFNGQTFTDQIINTEEMATFSPEPSATAAPTAESTSVPVEVFANTASTEQPIVATPVPTDSNNTEAPVINAEDETNGVSSLPLKYILAGGILIVCLTIVTVILAVMLKKRR